MLRWLLFPDTHFPREDVKKVAVMLKVLKRWKPDHLSFLGDLDDMEGPSRWADGTSAELLSSIKESSSRIKEFLYEVREILPDARIDYFMGNHEDRINIYLDKKAKALLGVIDHNTLYDLKNLGIEWWPYSHPPVERYKGFYIHHGLAALKHSGQSAKSELENFGVSGFSGHTHRLGAFYKTDMRGIERWFECGHLCDTTQMTYTVAPNWQSGFGYAYVDGQSVYPFLTEFVDDTVIIDGKIFK